MNTYRERLMNLGTTTGAYLRCILWGNFNYRSTSIFSFVGKKIKEHAPRTIRDTFGKVSILNHALNVQVFNIDTLKFFDVTIGYFMEKVFTLVGNLLVRFGNKHSSPCSANGALDPAREPSLSTPQELFGLPKVFRVLNLAPLRIGKERFNAYIETYILCGWGQVSNRDVIARERNEPFTGSLSPNRNGFYIAFNWSGKKEFKPTNVVDIEILSRESPPTLFKGKGLVSILPFESRETGLFFGLNSAEEGLKCSIEPFQYILKNLRTYYLELGKFSFKRWKLPNLVIARNRFLPLIVNRNPLLKAKIIESSTKLKPVVGFLLCLPVYFRFVEERFTHCFMYISTARRISSETVMPVSSDSFFNSSSWSSVR